MLIGPKSDSKRLYIALTDFDVYQLWNANAFSFYLENTDGTHFCDLVISGDDADKSVFPNNSIVFVLTNRMLRDMVERRWFIEKEVDGIEFLIFFAADHDLAAIVGNHWVNRTGIFQDVESVAENKSVFPGPPFSKN